MALRAMVPIAATVLLLLSPNAQAATSQYLCVDDQSVGLHFDKPPGRWTPYAFVPARYVLRALTLEEQDAKTQKYASVLSAFPEATWAYGPHPRPLAACRNRRVDESRTVFSCEPNSADARFDPESRRFQIIRGRGFIAQAMAEMLRRDHPKEYGELKGRGAVSDPDHPDDLVIEIGSCRES